jgi:hypothetical protein
MAMLLLATAMAGPALAQGRRPARQAPARPPAAPPPATREAPPPPIQAPLPEPRQRRITLTELGRPAGFAFGGEARDLAIPLPRDLSGLGVRLSLAFDLAAPFPAQHAVEVRANGRLLGARAFTEGARLTLDLPVPAEELAREPEALRLNFRLLEQPGPAAGTATLLPESAVALLLPDGAVPSIATLAQLMPPRVLVLLRPTGPSAPEAAAALRIGLALSATGREVRFTTGGAPGLVSGPGGARLWQTGSVAIGATAEAVSVLDLAGLPMLAIGGPDPEGAARLLEGPWRIAAGSPALATATAQPPQDRVAAIPFSALSPALEPQEAARAAWQLGFSTRDLPPATRPQAVELELRAAPDGGRAVASVLMNEVLLGAAPLPADGRLRLELPVPERLVGLENRVVVTLQRPAPGLPAQLLPGSALRLAPAPAPAEFLALPPRLAEGFEVLVDAPDGSMPAEALDAALWLLRALAPAGAPIAVTPVEPGTAAQPRRPFLALTREAPAGTAPAVRFDAGRIRLSDRSGARLMEIDATTPLLVAQLLETGGRHGVWLRSADGRLVPFALPSAAPRLDRGDVALLDRGGVSLAWSTRMPVLVSPSYPEAEPARSALAAWRPVVVGVLWLAGLGIVVYAFARPRRDEAAA